MNAFSAIHGGPGAVSMAVASGRVQLVTLRQRSLDLARWRVLWIALAFALAAMVALMRISYLGMNGEGARATSLADALLPPRGEITDRTGAPLARAFPAYALWFDPKAMGDAGAPLVHARGPVAGSLLGLPAHRGGGRGLCGQLQHDNGVFLPVLQRLCLLRARAHRPPAARGEFCMRRNVSQLCGQMIVALTFPNTPPFLNTPLNKHQKATSP